MLRGIEREPRADTGCSIEYQEDDRVSPQAPSRWPVDSVAAGDAFNGALAVSLAEGATLRQSVRMAAAAGALAVTKSGAQDSMPYRAEVEELLAIRGR